MNLQPSYLQTGIAAESSSSLDASKRASCVRYVMAKMIQWAWSQVCNQP